ncbi:MAG: FG-GAP-like repeat-containing protein [Flavobacteriales bacterium]|nr:FG-GAP-like repeat-containing protein [Flavobacteriales bacterium]
MICRHAIPFTLILTLVSSSLKAQVLFEEISIQSGIEHLQMNPMHFGGGVAILDFDNDGWEDVYFTGGQDSDKLYRNLGNGQFSDVSSQSGIASLPVANTMGVIAGDINNDGFQDLIITTFFGSETMLLVNQGDGTFNYLPNAINDGVDWKVSASFGDVNKDGYLDVYVTAYVFSSSQILGPDNEVIGFDHDCNPNILLINNGDLTFTEQGAQYGVDNEGCTLATAFTDFDNDSDIDINLSNDFGQWVEPSALYQNQFPTPSFLDVSAVTNMDIGFYGMGIAIGDYDRDADLDYYQTNLGRNLLSRNDLTVFADVTTEADVENDSLNGLNVTSWGCFFFDADNDGWPDLYVANGDLPTVSLIANVLNDPNKLFLNNGDGTFTDISASAFVDDTLRSRGAVYADFDKDGRVDIMVSNVHSSLDSSHVTYFHNISQTTNNWIQFELEGVQSNRDAYGSHVTIWLDGQATLAEVDGGSSHASKNSSILHFGIGGSVSVDSVEVVFPSGTSTTLFDVSVNQRHNIVEGLTVDTQNGFAIDAGLYFELSESGLSLHSTQNEPAVIEVFDFLGKQVLKYDKNLHIGKNQLPNFNLGSSAYFVRATTRSNSTVRKFVNLP